MTVEDVNGGAGDMPITVAMGGPLEEFKEVEEVKKLIGNIVNIYKDDIAVELTCERMQSTHTRTTTCYYTHMHAISRKHAQRMLNIGVNVVVQNIINKLLPTLQLVNLVLS